MTSYIQIVYLVTRYKWHISVALEIISKKKHYGIQKGYTNNCDGRFQTFYINTFYIFN